MYIGITILHSAVRVSQQTGIMMAADIDIRAVSNFSSIPESSITTLLDAPTSELVKSLLQGIEGKVKEHEQLKSQKVKLEVELETVVRTNESKVKVLQNSRDKALADTSQLRLDLQTSGKSSKMSLKNPANECQKILGQD